MGAISIEALKLRIEELENRLEESEQLIEAIKEGEVDAFAITTNSQSEVYTLQSGDYAYRVLIEEFSEGAVNVTEDGIIVYTNTYFFELINLPYERVVGSLFFDFIDKDSMVTFRELFSLALKGKSKGEIHLSINKRIIPVYISLTSLQPKLSTVGIIISDLTEKKKSEEVILAYQKNLETKNLELLQSNRELDSFAYLASHDLQEPLRKIQTFSNWILEKEYDNFSPKIKDYFNRIITSSKRMQNLITALLNYSRINTSEIAYVLTDLNLIVEEVKNDLNELIEENHVTVQTNPLPSLKIIPLQFNQLLSNIFINAIKYRKSDQNPLIKINSELVSNPTIDKQSAPISGKFWKIQIEDNGIGFEQQYENKIFELFQRLHGKSEYEGTGIGLAICKKIAQNHGGFINAVGKPGIGSQFNIYLPASDSR
jgi:PAS domain S-box-containing protein